MWKWNACGPTRRERDTEISNSRSNAPDRRRWLGASLTTAVVIAMSLLGPGVVRASTETPSLDCYQWQGDPGVRGYIGNTWLRVDSSWASDLCYQISGSGQYVGGRLSYEGGEIGGIGGIGAPPPSVPTIDSDAAACQASGNTVPGPHPVRSGVINDMAYLLDAYAAAQGRVEFCASLGNVSEHIAVAAPAGVPTVPTVPTVTPPSVHLYEDSTPASPRFAASESAGIASIYGTASAACQSGSRVFDLESNVANEYWARAAAGFARSSDGRTTEVCVAGRAWAYFGLGQRGTGGRLEVTSANGAPASPVEVTDVPDCTTGSVVFSDTQDGVYVTRSATTDPNSTFVCVQLTGVLSKMITVKAQPPGTTPPTVNWVPDQGT